MKTINRESFLPMSDGTTLYYRAWAVENPRALIFIHHGYGEHAGRYTHLAGFLRESGFAVFCFDARGHGQSGGRRAHVYDFSSYLDDLARMLEVAREQAPAPKVFLLGHSLGGLITLKFAIERSPKTDGIILSSPFLGLALKVPLPKLLLGRMMSRLWPTLTLGNEINSADLTHDAAWCADYDRDPLVNHVTTARWFTETTRAIEETHGGAMKLEYPCYFTVAGDDKIVSRAKTERFFSRVRAADKTLKIWPGLYHETFNELSKDQVFSEMLAWLNKRV
jgi:alpha-beta hydrolase superfamily lysophospholipase